MLSIILHGSPIFSHSFVGTSSRDRVHESSNDMMDLLSGRIVSRQGEFPSGNACQIHNRRA